jgi:hypothetical protein
VPRVDDRRVVSGIVYVIRNGLQWKDAPSGYGPPKTLYNRFIRLGVFNQIFAALAGEGPKPERIMIDARHLKTHRTAASLLKKGLFPEVSAEPRVPSSMLSFDGQGRPLILAVSEGATTRVLETVRNSV